MKPSIYQLAVFCLATVFSTGALAAATGDAWIVTCSTGQLTGKCKMTKDATDLYGGIDWFCILLEAAKLKGKIDDHQNINFGVAFARTRSLNTPQRAGKLYCMYNTSTWVSGNPNINVQAEECLMTPNPGGGENQ